ncbi:carboxylate-amine ligase [Streptomyces sp. HB2AG]|uniref:carboxylate-amine ligase n=1 Tax=Streptomyces sp. HB2AG TaxID=2983400 RepID=UPI0022AACEE2|nr:glutamate--cysteine ligase [Streptomyces sp. HB2AG]MCZ2524982.1 glutamate--cysteine ligase [Streptomyces sp. HB2AG]
MTTFGVEEEYLLIDPHSGMPVPMAEEVRASVGGQAALSAHEVQAELLQVQVEIATPVCETLDEVGGHLLRLRHAVGEAAERAGCRIAASGTAPLAGPVPFPVTDKPRYRAMCSDAPQLVDEQLINGMHVHVAVAERSTAIGVMNRLRPWLPVLVGMAGNSPLWFGHDTGFASWRTLVFGRWPVSGQPPLFTDAVDYERRVQALLAGGLVRDRGQLYWQVRPSDRYPTIEVRALDVQLRAEDAVMFAGIVRALVATALREEKAGTPFPAPTHEFLNAATWQAARYGLDDVLIDPLEGRRRRAGDVVCRLVEHISPALEESGDDRQVASLVHRLLTEGTPAARQRRTLHEGGVPALVDLLVTGTTAS